MELSTKSVPRLRALWFVSAAFLAACGAVRQAQGDMPPIGVPDPVAQSVVRHVSGSSGSLIYVSTAKAVIMVSYPQGKVVGSIPSYPFPSVFVCSDPNSGNVFIPENSSIYEYAHGATTPFATVALPNGYSETQGCAVDPTTGNLVASLYGSSNNGSKTAVAIYPGGQGVPKVYTDKKVDFFAYPACDDSGNVFVAAYRHQGGIRIAELMPGKRSFIYIKVANFNGDFFKLQWDGTYLDFSTTYGSVPGTAIDQVQISGTIGSIVNSIQLSNSRGAPLYFWIQDGAVFSELHKIRKKNNQGVGAWRYPAGGDPVSEFYGITRGGKDSMNDLTLSAVPNR